MPPPYLIVNVLIDQRPPSNWYTATSQDLLTLAASDPDLDTLVAGLPATITNLLYPDNGPLTVFPETVPTTAPTTAAYFAYASTEGA